MMEAIVSTHRVVNKSIDPKWRYAIFDGSESECSAYAAEHTTPSRPLIVERIPSPPAFPSNLAGDAYMSAYYDYWREMGHSSGD